MAPAASTVELNKLVSAALEAAKKAEHADTSSSETIGILKELGRLRVTTTLLAKTNAGRRLRPLQKHQRAAIASAAATTIAAWKAAVKREAEGGKADGGEAKPASPAAPAAAKNGAAASEAKPAPPAAATAAEGGSPSPASGSASALPPPPTGDALRDRCRSMFEQALARSAGEWEALRQDALKAADEGAEGSSSIQLPPPPDATTPAIAAAEVEQATYDHCGGTGPSYKAKVRQLSFNLKDARNPDLRRRVLSGELEPAALPALSAEEMASDAAREEIARIREKKLFDSSPSSAKKATTDAFQCGKCRQRKTTYYQMQTRSADEPMTTFVTCLVCNNRWKFC